MARFGAAARAWGFALAVCLMLCIAPPAPAEQESQEAFELQKNTAKKSGEEAGTKMLLPMGLLLGIVLVILIVPALAGITF